MYVRHDYHRFINNPKLDLHKEISLKEMWVFLHITGPSDKGGEARKWGPGARCIVQDHLTSI